MKTLLLILLTFATTLSLSATTLPSLNPYERIRDMSPADRRVAMTSMSPREITLVWSEQFKHADVNLVQRVFLDRVVSQIPVLLNDKTVLKSYEKEALELFPNKAQRLAVFNLTTFMEDCNCSVGSDFNSCSVCTSQYILTTPTTGCYICEATGWGCGFMGMMQCDGQCGSRFTRKCG